MKTSVSIALIVCGTVLIAMPHIHNMVTIGQLTETMAQLNKPVNLSGSLSKDADTACMVIGAIMVLAGVIGALLSYMSAHWKVGSAGQNQSNAATQHET